MRRRLAAGNWKMNGTGADLSELASMTPSTDGVEVLICPPATLIDRMARAAQGIAIGGQDCHANTNGAHTGDIAAEMIAEAGGSHVIVGHSERRTDHGESNAVVHDKVLAAWRAGLVAVLCIGETEAQYKAGDTLAVNRDQIAGSLPEGATSENTVIAYEPVWAIGTGLVPTTDEIGKVHGFIRSELTARFGPAVANGIRILYGGSVKPGNAAEIFATPDVDGALVGGASLKAADFNGIIAAL